MTIPQPSVYCSDFSVQAGEPMIGTATQTDTYLLIEYNLAWGDKALEQSELSIEIKGRLKQLGAEFPKLKTLLIRQERPTHRAGVRIFIACAREPEPFTLRFHLDKYDDLLHLDLVAALTASASDARFAPERYREPLFLVCTNGRRDVCCARRGVPTYNALVAATADTAEPLIWQSSHVGGHRFAPNLLCLPHGYLYGRATPSDAVRIVDAYRRGEVWLDLLRGHSAYQPAVQAAELHLRHQDSLVPLDALRLDEVEPIGEKAWRARFEVGGGGYRVLDVSQEVDIPPVRVYESCSLDKLTPIIRYVVR